MWTRMSSASEPPPQLGGRLHPAAIAVWPAQQAVALLVFFLFGGRSGFGGVLLAGAVALSVAAAAIRWWRFSWSVEGGTLVIEQGLLQRSRRVIPADRVQSVDLVRPLRHRVLGVVQVRVEAIGGSKTEGQLEALGLDAARAIQHALLGARAARRQGSEDAAPPAGEAPAEDVRVLARVRPRSLEIAGLTGGRVGVVAALLGGAQQLVGDRLQDAVGAVSSDLGVVVLSLLALAGVILVFLISVGATVVTYWGFEVRRSGDELRISRGLLEQRLETVPLRRIQSLRVEQNAVRRLVGLASVRADLAGRAGGDGDTSGVLLPAAPRAEAEALVADLLGTTRPVHAPLRPAPLRARRRYVVRGVGVAIAAALVALAAVLVLGGPWWAPVIALVVVAAVAVPVAVAEWRALGSAEVEGVLVALTGVLVRRRVHVPVGRVQTMTLSATPFQRRLDLADVGVGIARSGGWAGPRLPEVDADEALALMARVTTAAVEASRHASGPAGDRAVDAAYLPDPTPVADQGGGR